MARKKGNCVCFIRSLVRSLGMSTEQTFLTHLTPGEARLSQTVFPVLWVSEAFACKIGKTAAEVVRPNDPDGP